MTGSTFPSFFDTPKPYVRALVRFSATPPTFARQWGFDMSVWDQGAETPEEDTQLVAMRALRCQLLLVMGKDAKEVLAPVSDGFSVERRPAFIALQRRLSFQFMRGNREVSIELVDAAAYLLYIDEDIWRRHRPFPLDSDLESPAPGFVTAKEQWELDQFSDWMARRE